MIYMQLTHGFKRVLLTGAMAATSSAVELPRIFSDHGVLQQGEVVPIWGWGNHGESVSVEFDGQKVSGKADDNGGWRIELATLTANATGRRMTASGDSGGTVEVHDLLVGEVWMAAGQPNMQWSLAQIGRTREDMAAVDFPGIRIFLTHHATVGSPPREGGGSWLVANPSTAGEFSAVGYCFALKLHQEPGAPVGIIHTAWNGKPLETFTSREGLLTNIHPTNKQDVGNRLARRALANDDWKLKTEP